MTTDRAALIEAAAKASWDSAITCTGPGEVCCGVDTGWHSWRTHHGHSAALVLDAVLPLIADAIEAERDFADIGVARWHHDVGLRDAAQLVRSYLRSE